jgi:hypothetical protein
VDQEATTLIATDPNAGKAPTAQQIEEAKKIEARRFDLSVVRQQVLDLARDYEHTRAFLPVGGERTHKMEVIITKMRMLALAALPLLPELVSSPSLGARLAGIAILQVQPSPDYLQWLAARLAEDPGSFHGYHAAVALRSAAHVLGISHREEVQRAIETARKMAREGSKGADAFQSSGRGGKSASRSLEVRIYGLTRRQTVSKPSADGLTLFPAAARLPWHAVCAIGLPM